MRFVGVDASVLPTSSSARQVDDVLRARFAPGLDAPLHLAVRGRSAVPVVAAIRRFPAAAAVAAPQRVGPRLWTVDVVPRTGAMTAATKELVRALRRLPGVSVTGRSAWYLDTAASLLEMRNPVSLKQYFDERMATQFGARGSMGKPMLARLDLAEL